MVTKPTEPSQPALGPNADGLDFEIEDTTPAEVVEQERRFLAGQPADAEVEETPQPQGEAPQPTGEAPQVEPAPQPVATAPAPSPQPSPVPQPRVYSEDEWRKAQASWQRQIDAQKKIAEDAQKRVTEFDLSAQVEATLRQQERQYEATLGADEARRQVRSPENERAVRDGIQNAHRVKELEQQVRQAETANYHSLLGAFITDQTQKLGLSPRQAQRLMSLVGPHSVVTMEGFAATGNAIADMAAEFSELNKSTSQAQKAMRDRVPPETPETRLETGTSTTSGKRTVQQEMDRLLDKPTWQWTPQEHDFFTRNR